jgi:hypothetical protein
VDLCYEHNFVNFTAVAIDKEFRGLDYKNFLRHVQLFLKDRTQHLTNGELSFEFYTGTDITLQPGENRQFHSYYELLYFYDIYV